MQIEKLSVQAINPATYNPRKDLKPGDPDYEKLRRSMKEFGCVEPLVWNRQTGNLVGGHQRFKILVEQGATEVDVSVVDLPLDKEKVLNIALNKISGDWDNDKLASLIAEFSQIPDFDVGLTGFDPPEIEDLLESLAASSAGKEENFDVQAELDRAGPAITQPGDIIELGVHRVLCGDCSSHSSYPLLLNDTTADLLVTDPPYNVQYKAPKTGVSAGQTTSRWRPITGDHVPASEYDRWLGQVLGHVVQAIKPGSALYIWNGHKQFGLMHQQLSQLGVKTSAVITWAKPSFVLGRSDYKQQTEFCLYAFKTGSGHRWYGPLNESTLWNISRESTKTYQHPTQKPLELAERAMRNSSRAGEIVLDPFLGSGTTLIAAERIGRKCYGMEIDPLYCDVIVRRYIGLVGQSRVDPALVSKYCRKEVAA